MISKTIWCYALLCVLVKCKKAVITSGEPSSEDQINIYDTENGRLVNSSFVDKSREARIKEMKKIKRGIVLVDEDFDVPSAIYAHENKSGTDEGLRSDIFNRDEGSGNDVFDEKEIYNATKDDTHQHTEYYSTSTLSTTEVTPEVTTDTTLSTTLEGSGDDILGKTKEYSVTEMKTTSHTSKMQDFHEEIPDVCMNFTCSQDDLFLSLSGYKNLIPEGTNLTLSCKSNNSNHNMLYWYKSNGTLYYLQAIGTEGELLLNIPDAKAFHSGTYICVTWINRQTCCNLKLNLSVYEIPLYKYYLIILGLIVAACLLICIFLSVRQVISLRTYTKQFVEKHGKIREQLL